MPSSPLIHQPLELPSFSAVSFSLISNDMSLFSASFAYADSIEVFAKRGSREICKPNNVPEILKKDPTLVRSLHVHPLAVPVP
jgi:hypothetical protein